MSAGDTRLVRRQNPAFNVGNFSGILHVHLNKPMATMLIKFIDEIEGRLEPQIFALRNKLLEQVEYRRPHHDHQDHDDYEFGDSDNHEFGN